MAGILRLTASWEREAPLQFRFPIYKEEKVRAEALTAKREKEKVVLGEGIWEITYLTNPHPGPRMGGRFAFPLLRERVRVREGYEGIMLDIKVLLIDDETDYSRLGILPEGKGV